MKTHSNKYKEMLKKTRQSKSKLTYNNITVDEDDLLSIKLYFNSNILKSAMKVLEFDYKNNIELKTQINFQYGIKVNENYEYVNYGNYIVNKSEYQEDTKIYHITCYDKMLYSMKQNENLGITYPISIRNYIKALCTKIGLEFKNQNETFANYDKMINQELYLGQDYTYRDILDELAQVTASTICINNDDKLEIRYINNTNDIIKGDMLKNINVTFKEKYGPINSIVLSRSAESDNVYLQDKESVKKNGLCEIKIKDNQILNWNDRSDYLPDILKKLNGLEYYLNDFASPGITYLDLCDKYSVENDGNTYTCIMFNDETNITQGLEENVYTEMPEQSQTDYTKADKTDRKINQTYLLVDKQNKKIEAAIENVNDISTTNKTVSNKNSLYIEDALEENALEFRVKGKCEQETRSGKNKLPITNTFIGEITVHGVKLTLNNDGTIVANGTSIAAFNIYLQSDYSTVKAGTYTLSDSVESGEGATTYFLYADVRHLDGTPWDEKNMSTLSSEKSRSMTEDFLVKSRIVVRSGQTLNNVLFKPMLEEGTAATEYEQYGVSPSPDYPSEINTIKGIENLIDITTVTKGIFILVATGKQQINNNWSQSDYIKVTPNTDYTLSNSIAFAGNGYFEITTYTKDKTWISSKQVGRTGDKSYTFITDSNTYYVRVGVAFLGDKTNDFQLKTGKISGPYVPYGNWLVEKITGNNLLNSKSGFVNKYISSDGNQADGNNNALFNQIIKVEPNTKYIVSSSMNIYVIGIGEYDKNNNFIQRVLTPNNQFTREITTSSNCEYIRLYINYDGSKTITQELIDTLDLMFAKDTKNYEPYKERNVLINLKGNELCSTKDLSVRDELVVTENETFIDKKIAKIVLDGSETIKEFVSDTNRTRFSITINDIYNYSNRYTIPKIISNYFVAVSQDKTWAIGDISMKTSEKSIWLTLNANMTQEQVKTWLSQNNVVVYYVLATPEKISLDKVDIPLYENINNLTLLEDLETDTSVKYLTNNSLNQMYATRTQLKLTETSITSEVNAKFANYSDKTEMTNIIEQKITDNNTNYVNIEVGKKVNSSDYNSAQILAKINNDESSVQIKADKINLNGVISANNTFKIDTDGSMEATGGKIGGWTITSDRIISNPSEKNTIILANGANEYNDVLVVYDNVNGTVPFYLHSDGFLSTTKGLIAGIYFSASGLYYSGSDNYDGFGLWKNGAHSADNNYIIFHAGGNSNHIADANFRIYQNGNIHANNATITGKINATSGYIGSSSGWNIGSTYIYNGGLNGNNGARLYSDGRMYMKSNYGWINSGSGGNFINGNGSANRVWLSDDLSTSNTGNSLATIGIRALHGHVRIASNDTVNINASHFIVNGSEGWTGYVDVRDANGSTKLRLHFKSGICTGYTKL